VPTDRASRGTLLQGAECFPNRLYVVRCRRNQSRILEYRNTNRCRRVSPDRLCAARRRRVWISNSEGSEKMSNRWGAPAGRTNRCCQSAAVNRPSVGRRFYLRSLCL